MLQSGGDALRCVSVWSFGKTIWRQAYAIPQSKINAYICTNFSYFHIVKAKPSRPSQNVEEFAIELQMMYKDGRDPFKCEFNHTDRKFGNSWEYRSVENATYEMLGMTTEESRQAFMKMYRN